MTSVDLTELELSENSLVEPLADGEMGSFRFVSSDGDTFDRRFGKPIIRGEFEDADGVLVIFSLNADQIGRLFELDLWRVDFDPLVRLPSDDALIRID